MDKDLTASQIDRQNILNNDAALAEILAGRGTKFDAQIVDLCVALFREEGFVFQADPIS